MQGSGSNTATYQNTNNMNDEERNAINKEIRAEMGIDKLNDIFTSFNKMDEYSEDKGKAFHLIGLLERGFVPLEMRQYGHSSSFIEKHSEFKLDSKYNENIISNAVKDRYISDVSAIRSIENPTKDSLFGGEFGRFMGIDTTKAFYLKNEDGMMKDYKNELYGNFDKEYYNKIDRVYIVNDVPGNTNFKNENHDYIKDIKYGEKIAVKDFVSLQITTFEVHKTDGDIEYKSFFTNNAGQVLAEIPDSGTAEILLGDSKDSKCEAINTVKIELENVPKDFENKLRGASIFTIEGAANRQSYNISQNVELTKNEIDVLSDRSDLLRSAINCICAERADVMNPLKESYLELVDKAKNVANEIKVLEITDKTSEKYTEMKTEVIQHISEYKEKLALFDKEYKSTELFDDKVLSNTVDLLNDTLERLDNAETRKEIIESDIIKGKDNDGNRIDPLTRFRGIIGIDRTSSLGSDVDISNIKEIAQRGRNVIESRVQDWNESHKDNPLKIDDNGSVLKIYDKHGFERDIQNIEDNKSKNFNPDMVDEGASRPDANENGEISDNAIESFVAEDEDIYKDFDESFEVSDVVIDKDYEYLIEKYIDDDSINLSDYGLENQALKDEISNLKDENVKNDIIDDSKKFDNDDNDDVSRDENVPEHEESKKGTTYRSTKDIDKVRADSKHIDYIGKIEISNEKKEAIKKEVEKELKGVSNDKYKELFDRRYVSKIEDATQKLEIIADKINTLEKRIENRTERLGMRASNQNLVVINDRSKIDSLINDYKKEGGAIGRGYFVKSTPTFLDSFSRVVEAYHSNIFNTAIYEAFLKIDSILHPDREEPYKVDTNRDNISSNNTESKVSQGDEKEDEDKVNIDNEDKGDEKEDEDKVNIDNEDKGDEKEDEDKVNIDNEDKGDEKKDEDKVNIDNEYKGDGKEDEDKITDDDEDKGEGKEDERNNKDDEKEKIIEEIKSDIKDKIEDFFNEIDTINDKLEDYLEILSPSDLIDFSIESITSIYEQLTEIFNTTGDDAISESGFIDKVAELFSDIANVVSDNTDSPVDSIREEIMNNITDSELPSVLSDSINDGISDNVIESDTITDFGSIDGTDIETLDFYSGNDVITNIENNISNDMGVDSDVANDSKVSVAVNNTTTDLEDSGFESEDSYKIAEDAVAKDIDNGLSFDEDNLSIPTNDSLNNAIEDYENNSVAANNDNELDYSNGVDTESYLPFENGDFVTEISESDFDNGTEPVSTGDSSNPISDTNFDDFDSSGSDVSFD